MPHYRLYAHLWPKLRAEEWLNKHSWAGSKPSGSPSHPGLAEACRVRNGTHPNEGIGLLFEEGVCVPTEADRRCRVFVVDDERVIASTIAIILNQHGYEACDFFSGEAALEAIRSQPPDVLITDLVMPGMSGVQLALEVRKQFPECRIMLFSGQIETSSLLQEAQKLGVFFPVHTKPIHPERLLAMLGRWRRPDLADDCSFLLVWDLLHAQEAGRRILRRIARGGY